MKASSLVAPVLLSALVAGQWIYLWTLREDVHRLSRRVESLSSELARSGDAAPPAPINVEAIRAAVLSTRSAEPAAPEMEQKVRGAVADELKRQREENVLQAEAVVEEIKQNMRQKVARELQAGDIEVARLEDLGNALQDVESELREQSAAGTLSGELKSFAFGVLVMAACRPSRGWSSATRTRPAHGT